jgi:multisubunit Na+/H+ antiporter MnhE subunit
MLLWVLLTSTLRASELVVGAVAAVLAGVAVHTVRHRVTFGFRPKLRWLRRAVPIPWRIVSETWQTTAALVRHVTGSKRVRGALVAVPFRHGPPADPEAAARRALVTAGLSAGPNTVVVGIDPDRDELLVHQLVPDVVALRRNAGGP